MKLELDIDGQLMEAEFDFAQGQARLTREGRTYQAQVSEPEPGLFVLIFEGRVYRCALDRSPNGETEVVVNGARLPVAVRDRKRLRAGVGERGRGSGRVTLSAPMPGKVVRVLCQAGDEVAANQGVLVVEAMKMQNEVQAPKAGKVVELRAHEGQTVNAGEVLVIIE